MQTNFTRQPRPSEVINGDRNGFSDALRDTLKAGDVVVVPLNGTAYVVMRSRRCTYAYKIAKQLNVRLRTTKSADGLSLLIWLEAKKPAPITAE